MNAASPYVFDVTDRDFETRVLERSRQVPVVVDFWAPWCGPCRMIGPVLEKLAAEANGAWLLAKVNTDENPTLSEALQITSIPLVMAFKDGKTADEFVGALPEAQIREFVQALLPGDADRLADEGEKKRAGGRFDEAETLFRSALEKEADQPTALLGLARIHADRQQPAEALALLERIPPGAQREPADRLAAEIRVRQSGGADLELLRKRLAESPTDLAARLALARQLAATGLHEEAFDHFLELVRRDRTFEDDAGRRGMLDLFQLLGPDHPLTERYRSELGRTLFA